MHDGSIIHIKTIDLDNRCYTYDLDVQRLIPIGEESKWILKNIINLSPNASVFWILACDEVESSLMCRKS